MKLFPIIVVVAIVSVGCSKPLTRHKFVPFGVKDLPLILLDQDTGRICYAGDAPAPGPYLEWYNANVGRGTPSNSSESYFFCSDEVLH